MALTMIKLEQLMHPLDPKLSLLASNGGDTQTMALMATSPAIGAGYYGAYTLQGNTLPAISTDQRGIARNQPMRYWCL